MNFELLEESFRTHNATDDEAVYVRARTLVKIGNEYYWQGKAELARKFYGAALKKNPGLVSARVKTLLLTLGRPGDFVRRTILSFR